MANVDVEPRSDQEARAPMRKRRRGRIYHTAGPGNLVGAYRAWSEGTDLSTEVAVTYSGQFFDVCRRLDMEAQAVASSPTYTEAKDLRDGPFRVRERPSPWESWGWPWGHLGEYIGDLWHVAAALRQGSDILLLHGGYLHWYLFSLLRPFGVEIVPILMVVLWPKHRPPGRLKRLFLRFNGWLFFRHSATAILSMSEDCTRQILEICGGRSAPIIPFVPKYRPDQFDDQATAPEAPPFRVLYAGRIERYKGVFDLLEIAERFAAEGRDDIEFDLCGMGPATDELKAAIAASGLGDRFRMHGHCDRTTMRRMYARAHVVIAPTRTDFVEGFNQVVAEAAISGKPVITSSVCPALEAVREAAVEVPPDDVKAYGDAILKLRDDPALYREKIAACPAIRERFLGSDLIFDRALEGILASILERKGLIAPR